MQERHKLVQETLEILIQISSISKTLEELRVSLALLKGTEQWLKR